MPLGMEVGLSPEDFVFDGDPAPSPKRGWRPPIFDPCLLRSNGCMDQDATWYGGRPRPTSCGQTAGCVKMPIGMEVGLSPGDFVSDRDPDPLLNFRPMFIIVIVISLLSVQVQVLVLYAFYF